MIRRPFGADGPLVPVIGAGTWNVPLRGAAADEAKRALRAGIDRGVVHIDTAEMYGDGAAETFVGEAIAGLPREHLFLVSKVLPSNASYAGTIRACEASLRRLGVDYLDCYLLHWRGNIPLRETMRAFEQLIADGKIRALGVSNFEVADIEDARRALEREKIACNQVLYHLGERSVEAHEFAYAREAGIAIVGYTPFGRGSFADGAAYAALETVAARHGVTPRAVVLAFLTRDPIAFAIPKAAQVAHMIENAAAGDVQLSEDDIAEIDRAYPRRKRRGGLPVL
jgi:diketogulonate reductase-like aldo/keto reductase